MGKKVVRIWTDVVVDANTEQGAMAIAAAKAIEDGGETIHWNFQTFMTEEQYNEFLAELESISLEGAKQETANEPATKA